MDSTSAQPAVSPADLLGHHAFFAMNTRILLLSRSWDSAKLLCEAEQVFLDVEERFSRFRPSSELSRLNDMSGRRVTVSTEMFHLLDQCRRFHRVSGGLFDPAILPDLESAGYDRSFELVPAYAAEPGPAPSAAGGGSIADLAMDPDRLSVQAPPGVRLDLGELGISEFELSNITKAKLIVEV